MTWFRVDDAFAIHHKAIAAGNAALGLWVRAGAWCSGNLTDGALPKHMVGTFGAQRRDAQRLVAAGLWSETPDGYQFNDWGDWQYTKAQVKAKRAADKTRQQAHREGRRHAVTDTVTPPVTNGVSHSALTKPNRTSSEVPPSTPPDTKPKRATGAPAELPITDAMRTWATAHNIRIDLERETARFLDYHRAKGSTFKDWTAAWRTWMSRAGEYAQPKLGLIRNPEEIHSPGTGWAR